MGGSVGSAAGEAITRGAGEGRLILIGANGLGEYPARSGSQLDTLNRWPMPSPLSCVGSNYCGGFLIAQ
jgi:hypothetical protein